MAATGGIVSLVATQEKLGCGIYTLDFRAVIYRLLMDVSIIIRTKNEGESIDKTIQMIKQQDFSGTYEVIIVDSGSTDRTLEIVEEHQAILLQMSQSDFNFSRSLNLGIREARGNVIVSLSAHALPTDQQWLRNLVSPFEDEDVAGTYGRQVSAGEVNPFDALKNGLFFGDDKIVFNLKNENMLKKIHFSNSNSAFRRNVWQRFKFNEEVWGFEDILWQREVIRAGFSIVYSPGAVVSHTHDVCLQDTYERSKNCSYTLAVMSNKRRSVPMALCDVLIFFALTGDTMLQNLRYIWEKKYLGHLKIVPLFVLAQWSGWLVGRVKYRLGV